MDSPSTKGSSRGGRAVKADFFCAVVNTDIYVEVERKRKGECSSGCLLSARRGSSLRAFHRPDELKRITYNRCQAQIYDHRYSRCNKKFRGDGWIYWDMKNWISREIYNTSKGKKISNGKIRVTWRAGVNTVTVWLWVLQHKKICLKACAGSRVLPEPRLGAERSSLYTSTRCSYFESPCSGH